MDEATQNESGAQDALPEPEAQAGPIAEPAYIENVFHYGDRMSVFWITKALPVVLRSFQIRIQWAGGVLGPLTYDKGQRQATDLVLDPPISLEAPDVTITLTTIYSNGQANKENQLEDQIALPVTVTGAEVGDYRDRPGLSVSWESSYGQAHDINYIVRVGPRSQLARSTSYPHGWFFTFDDLVDVDSHLSLDVATKKRHQHGSGAVFESECAAVPVPPIDVIMAAPVEVHAVFEINEDGGFTLGVNWLMPDLYGVAWNGYELEYGIPGGTWTPFEDVDFQDAAGSEVIVTIADAPVKPEDGQWIRVRATNAGNGGCLVKGPYCEPVQIANPDPASGDYAPPRIVNIMVEARPGSAYNYHVEWINPDYTSKNHLWLKWGDDSDEDRAVAYDASATQGNIEQAYNSNRNYYVNVSSEYPGWTTFYGPFILALIDRPAAPRLVCVYDVASDIMRLKASWNAMTVSKFPEQSSNLKYEVQLDRLEDGVIEYESFAVQDEAHPTSCLLGEPEPGVAYRFRVRAVDTYTVPQPGTAGWNDEYTWASEPPLTATRYGPWSDWSAGGERWKPLVRRELEYDAAGRLRRSVLGGRVDEYTFDARGNLTRAKHTGNP